MQDCWQPNAEARPEADKVLTKLKVLLDETSPHLHTTEKFERTALHSNSDLYFKPREISTSLDEYMYDDTNEISDSLLLSYKTERVIPTVPLAV